MFNIKKLSFNKKTIKNVDFLRFFAVFAKKT